MYFYQDEVSRASRDERPSVSNALTERKVESAAGGNHNKVKSMATQLLAKFEENAPAQSSGLKRQVGIRMGRGVVMFNRQNHHSGPRLRVPC